MALLDQTELLCLAVRQKGVKEAEAVGAKARRQADALLEETRQEAELAVAHHLMDEKRQANQEARQVIDTSELKARRDVMTTREALLKDILEEGWQRLLALRDGPAYPDIAEGLAVAAVSGIPGRAALLAVRPEDRHLFPDEKLREIGERSNHDVQLLDEAAQIAGGCLAYGEGRRVLADFSFSALVRRAEPSARDMLGRALAKMEG